MFSVEERSGTKNDAEKSALQVFHFFFQPKIILDRRTAMSQGRRRLMRPRGRRSTRAGSRSEFPKTDASYHHVSLL